MPRTLKKVEMEHVSVNTETAHTRMNRQLREAYMRIIALVPPHKLIQLESTITDDEWEQGITEEDKLWIDGKRQVVKRLSATLQAQLAKGHTLKKVSQSASVYWKMINEPVVISVTPTVLFGSN
jgi:hypothetical protein